MNYSILIISILLIAILFLSACTNEKQETTNANVNQPQGQKTFDVSGEWKVSKSDHAHILSGDLYYNKDGTMTYAYTYEDGTNPTGTGTYQANASHIIEMTEYYTQYVEYEIKGNTLVTTNKEGKTITYTK